MTEAKQARIQALMAQGLDFYAIGEDQRAIQCWQQVLELEPEHAEAQDYLRTASDDGSSASEVADPVPADAAEGGIVGEALALLRRGDAAEALELLETLGRSQGASLHVEAWIDHARGRLWGEYRRRLCDGIAVPQLRVRRDDVLRYNLPPQAGFVLSRMDGSTSVDEILELVGGDPFETLRTCCRLIDAGIVEVHP